MSNEVSAWLANPNRNYAEGVEIYNKYKRDAKFDNYFASVAKPPSSSMQFRMLVDKLMRIDRILKANPSLVVAQQSSLKPIVVKAIDTSGVTKKVSSDKAKRPAIVDNPMVNVKELPADLQVKYYENKELTKLLTQKHQALEKLGKDTVKDSDRKRIADEIIKLDDTRAANWKAIDEWWKANEAKSPTTAEQKNADDPSLVDKVNRINNLKNYIRRANAETEKKPGNKTRNAKKIEKWQKELNELTGKHTE